MTDIGYQNKVLQSTANYVYDGSIWRPAKADNEGNTISVNKGLTFNSRFNYLRVITDISAGVLDTVIYTFSDDYVWQINEISFFIGSTTVNKMLFSAVSEDVDHVFYNKASPPLNIWDYIITNIYASQNDYIRVVLYNCTLNDSIAINLFTVKNDYL